MDEQKVTYNLEERTALFGENIIKFVKKIKMTPVNSILVNQLVRSSTSIGANYCEADDASSKKDFVHKIGLCRKEARETKHWLRMLAVAEDKFRDELAVLWKEAKELHLIFVKIVKTTKVNLEKS